MKSKDLAQFKNKELKELKKISLDRSKEIAKISLEIKSQKEKNLKKARNLKKDLAQILTLMREKEILAKEVKE